MKTIYLIRHTEQESTGALTPRGQEQAQHMAEKVLRPAKLYTSELQPAMQTAQAICDKWHVRPEPLPCLNEHPYDLPSEPILAPPMMMGMPAAFQPQKEIKPLFTFDDLNHHIDTFLKLAPKFPHRTTCVVHEKWLHLLLWRVLGFRADTLAEQTAFHTWQATTPSPEAWYLHIGDSWETWLQVLDLNNQK